MLYYAFVVYKMYPNICLVKLLFKRLLDDRKYWVANKIKINERAEQGEVMKIHFDIHFSEQNKWVK